jgi:hypothetical protein
MRDKKALNRPFADSSSSNHLHWTEVVTFLCGISSEPIIGSIDHLQWTEVVTSFFLICAMSF